MSYYVFLGVIPLPITPAKISITTPSKNQTVTLINDGEINILKTPGLREISFDFLLPQNKYPFMNEFALAKENTASVYIPLLNTLNGNGGVGSYFFQTFCFLIWCKGTFYRDRKMFFAKDA